MEDPASLNNRARDLQSQYEDSGNMEDLEQAITLYRSALTVCPPSHPNHSEFLTGLAVGLGSRYNQLGNIEDLEEAISLDRNALCLHPPDHPSHISLDNLAANLMIRYKQLGKMEDLEEGIALNHDALSFHPQGHPNRSISLSNLAAGLALRYGQLGKMEDLEGCIALNRDALVAHLPGHADYSLPLNNLANALGIRYEQLGRIEDLEECIALNRNALALRCPGHPNRSSSLNNLANALSTRYEQLGRMDDLEECIALIRDSLALRLPGHPDRSSSLNNLASALNIRYEQLGRMDDLEECIALNRDALALFPPGHPDRSSSLNNLASALSIRYEQLGRMDDLEECIALNRDALALCPPGHPYRSTSLNNLASALSTRYEQLEKMDDLEECIALNRDALALRLPDHHDRSSSLNNLASALIIRYGELEEIDDLEECITLNRNALALRPPGHPDRSSSLNNLANALSIRYGQLGRMDDLEESIALNRDSLALRLPGHPRRFSSLNSLANALIIRYEQLEKMDDLEECIALNRNAIALCPPGHPNLSSLLTSLADVLNTRFQGLSKVQDLQEMFTLYEQAASDFTSYLTDRLEAAVKWSQITREYNHEFTLNAYTVALQLLQRSLISRPDVEGQYEFLAAEKQHTSLPLDAASAAIQAGNLELAVEFLEHGRAMLWSRIGAYKYPLEQLRQVEGGDELADRLEILNADLERLVLLIDRTQTDTMDRTFSTGGGISLDHQIKQHRILCEDWEGLVGMIREKCGFAHFLQTPPFDTLQSAAAEGPVILLNISDYRSDAIILTINNPPSLVTLSSGKPVGLADQVNRLTTNRAIVGVLRYLWESIVSPVVARLEELGMEKHSRIWWCPTGELCALPLHAAGVYRLHEENLPDIYTSSYVSTLSSLIRARLNLQPPQVPKLLVIGQNNETLPNVDEEVEGIKQHGCSVTVLLGPRANRKIVLNQLKHHSWVHFACHGHLGDNNQPFHASFELYNGRRLTLLELIRARLPNAESAFLAACHTAGGDARTPDEHIHLSAALQFCGFRSVVGTLWEMFDDDGPMISKEFYEYMFQNPEHIDFRDSAYALSSAVRAMQKAKLPPERWVMFIHIGA